ncbi:YhgE/Pip domain-containing protein [Paenibacillus sp. KQZ6P-2]|uniref:YhgE/Pip domain-containing protein n=1 Tax=Paenibacillus mangrovi TaxID=2931978 RepID=A0A9X1WSD5_9BACL|nr:YhgE/Pip domain-containing protein [Paenibacillus mangrovi]MCJ8014397.1 YhgE/Pip domain-containing protein [Paenibacillus mangrovi]
MRSLSVFVKDMAATVRNRKLLISMVAVICIPVMYAGLFLTAFWDPYAKMDQLPVAVVNKDTGAEYGGQSLKIGQDLVDELKKSDDFDWKFVSREEAEKGMADNKYYMTIVIPEDFSSKSATVLDEHPQPSEIIFEPNEGYNFLASQIGGSAIKEIKSQVSEKVTESYSKVMFDEIKTVSSGLGEAGNGASDISDGAGQLDEGAAKLKENLSKMVAGTVKLEEGIQPLSSGAGDLQKGAVSLKEGSQTLAGGLNQLSSAHKQLEDGVVSSHQGSTQLKDGLAASEAGSAKLQAGLQTAVDGSGKLEAGLASTLDGSGKLQEGLKQSEAGSSKLAESLKAAEAGGEQVASGAQSVAQGLQQLAQANPELAQNPAVQKLIAASQAVAKGSEQLHQGQQQLSEGAAQLNKSQQQLSGGASSLHAGLQQLSGGATQLSQGAEQLTAGVDQLHQGQQQLLQGATKLEAGQSKLEDGMKLFGTKLAEAANGSQQLASGAGQLADGSGKLQGGMSQLGSGVTAIADGSKQLDNGAGQLSEGLGQLKDGSTELASKLNEAAEKSGEVKVGDDNFKMFAEPVKIQENKISKVPNYGTGFAPYFLSLGLFVGALISTIVLPMRDTSVLGASGYNRFISRTLSFVLMSVLQSLLAALVMLYGLKLEVQNVPLFYVFTFITSLSFTFMVQAFVTWLDQPGRFVVIVLLIFQLTTSAGTFPLEMIPDWMKILNPLLPMTYSVVGFKSVISTGDFSLMWNQAAVLGAVGIVFLALTLTYFLMKSHKGILEQQQESPSLSA